jgi:hypothetical protein
MATQNPNVSNARVVLSVFEKYQKERLSFVQTIADLASRETNIETLQQTGVLSLLRPLLLDNVPAIQQAAALALGRLANYNEELAEAVVESDILPQLVFSLNEQNVLIKDILIIFCRDSTRKLPHLFCALLPSIPQNYHNLS